MSRKAQTKREEIISEMQMVRYKLLAEVAALSRKERDTVFLGIWSVRDILAHLAGWDFANTDAIKSIIVGKLPVFYEYYDHDWQTYNAMLVKKFRRDTFRETRATLKKSQKRLVESLQNIQPEHFNRDFGLRFHGEKVTIQQLLEADIEDVTIHHQQIVDFFGKKKNNSGQVWSRSTSYLTTNENRK